MLDTTSQKVIIYGAEWCPPCHMVKNYLTSKDTAYEYRNVDEDRNYGEEAVKKSGQFGIPVVDIAGEIVVGFDRPKIDGALRKHGLIK